ncbi:hypothetical protein [Microbacterium sp. GXF6406]
METLILLAVIVLVIALLLLVIAAVLASAARRRIPRLKSAATQAVATLSADTEARVRQLLAEGKQIEAVKLVREQTGAGMLDAKQAVDRQASGLPAAPMTLPSTVPSPEASAEIDRLLDAGRHIEAIKVLRENTGLGLKQAKDRIDAWRPSL